MGIKFDCVHCGHTLHVKDYLAGKRGICPHCQAKIDIPLSTDRAAQTEDSGAIAVELRSTVDEPATREMDVRNVAESRVTAAGVPGSTPTTSRQPDATTTSATVTGGAASVDPISEAPQLQWYVLPPGSITKYGPAQGEMMRAWLAEGRVAAEAMVWREGWPQWRPAAAVFPQLVSQVQPTPGAATVVAPQPTVTMPVATIEKPAMIVGVDDPLPVTHRGAIRRPTARRAREQRNLMIGLLAALVALVFALFVFVLMRQ